MTGLDKRTVNKSSQRALCRTYATSSRLHFSYLFDPVWSSYSCPLVHALCKKFETAFSFLCSLSISHPLPACLPACPPPLPPSHLALSSPPPPLLFNFFFPPSSLALHPAFTHLALLELVCVRACECVCVNLSEISLFRGLTASTDSEGTASSQDMKNASHKFVIRPWVIMAKAPITSD